MITRRGRLGLTFTVILVLVWTLTPAPIPIGVEIHRTKPAINKGPVSYEQKLQNKKLAARYAYLGRGMVRPLGHELDGRAEVNLQRQARGVRYSDWRIEEWLRYRGRRWQ